MISGRSVGRYWSHIRETDCALAMSCLRGMLRAPYAEANHAGTIRIHLNSSLTALNLGRDVHRTRLWRRQEMTSAWASPGLTPTRIARTIYSVAATAAP